MDWSELTLQTGKQVRAVPVVDVVAFSCDVPEKSGPGFDRFMRTFTARFGDQFTFYRTGDMKRYRAFERTTLDGPSHWFSDPTILASKLLGYQAHAGNTQQQNMPPALDIVLKGLFDPQRFTFRVSLPIGVDGRADELVSLVQEALADFPLAHGYCGYSLLWEKVDPTLVREVCEWAAPLLLRYPGLNYGNVGMTVNAAPSGAVVVSWLTFLGAAIVADLGGLEELSRQCPSDVSLLRLPRGGGILRAGAGPALGDANRGDKLPLYQAVGRMVAPRRADDEALENAFVEGLTAEQNHAWLRRFFE